MARKSRKNVGLIGLGIIGSRVAAGLRASGYHVFLWNRTPKAAPNFLGSPAEVAEVSEIIQLFVSDSQAVFQILEMLGDALTPRHVIVCNATIGAEATLEAARLVEDRGARFLDAPFTGSRDAADRSQLVYYVGGEEEIFARVRPVLEASSKAIVRCGKIGNAATLKVVTNMIAAVSTQALAEALAITRSAGISAELLGAALEQNACRSGTIDLKLPKMVMADYGPHFSLKHMFKDVQLGIHLANSLDLEIPTTTVTAGVMYGALNNGWADLDFASIYKIYDGALAAADQARALPEKDEEAKGALLGLPPASGETGKAEEKSETGLPEKSAEPGAEAGVAPPVNNPSGTQENPPDENQGEEAKREPLPSNVPEIASDAKEAPHPQDAPVPEAAGASDASGTNGAVPPSNDTPKPLEHSAPDQKDASPAVASKPGEAGAIEGERPAGKPFNRIIRRFFSAATEK